MRKIVVVVLLSVAWFASVGLTSTQPHPDQLCEVFKRNADGSWTNIKPITLETTGPGANAKVQIGPGQIFGGGASGVTSNVIVAGIGDPVERLEKDCRK